MATKLQNCVDMAQDHYTSDDVRLDLRERDILEARGALAALDHMLAKCYRIMLLNPQGCFSTGKKSTEELTAAEAQDRLDRWSQRLGEKIDQEERKLNGLLKSDAELRRKRREGKK